MSWRPPLFPWGAERQQRSFTGFQKVWWLGQGAEEFLPCPQPRPAARGMQCAVSVLQLRDFHSVLQMVLEGVPEPMR